MKKEFKVGNKVLDENSPAYIIAEMSANHGGSLDRALELVRVAKEIGADCIKIQTYTADTLTIDSNKEYFNIKKGTWTGENLYKLYEQAHTPWEWQKTLKEEADKIGIDFLSTPYDFSSVDFLEELEVDFYKIASFELIDIPLVKYIASKKKPIIMSTGMATLGEIEEAVNAIRDEGNEALCLLRCSSAYPAASEDMKLKIMDLLSKTFDVKIGLSDHSMDSIGAIAAVAMGAKVIEKHFCLSRDIETADSSFSMEPEEFKKMVADIRQTEKVMGNTSFRLSEKEKGNRMFRKSIFVVKDIKQGEIYTEENIRIIRPGYGLAPKHYQEILGKKASKDIEWGEPIEWNMIE